MNRREAAEEPSMEDILASIRKIIADEPVAAASAPALPLPHLSPVGSPDKHFATQQPSLTARLNDVFGPGSVIPGDHHAVNSKSASAPRPVRSVIDDDLGDMLADLPIAPFKPATQSAAVTKPAPTVIAGPPARSRPFTLDSASTDLLSGRSSIPAPHAPPGSDTSRSPQSSLYPVNARLTELRTNQPAQGPAAFDTQPVFPPQPVSPPQSAPHAPAQFQAPSQPEATRAAPVVIASMTAMEQRPLPTARPFSAEATAPAAVPATPLPLPPSPAAFVPPAQRPEPTVLASSAPVSFVPAPIEQAIPATPAAPPVETAAKPTGISTSTLDFLMPSKQTSLAPVAVATTTLAPEAPFIPAFNLDFLKPAPKSSNELPEEPSEAVIIAATPPEQAQSLTPVAVVAAPASAPPATIVAAPSIPPASASPPALVSNEPASVDPAAAVASALGALAAGLAASSREPIPEIVVSAVEVSPPKTTAANGLDDPGATTPLAASTGVSVFSSTDQFVGGTQLKPISTSTLDDTAAELLRPMLRQWLDANMPRIVERALRIELTDAVTLPIKTEPEK